VGLPASGFRVLWAWSDDSVSVSVPDESAYGRYGSYPTRLSSELHYEAPLVWIDCQFPSFKAPSRPVGGGITYGRVGLSAGMCSLSLVGGDVEDGGVI